MTGFDLVYENDFAVPADRPLDEPVAELSAALRDPDSSRSGRSRRPSR